MFYDKSISSVTENGKQVNLVSLSVPLFMEQIFVLLYGTVNTLILSGRSPEAVSATGVAQQIINVMICIMAMVSKGTVIVSSVALGSKKEAAAREIAGTGAFLAMLLSLAASGVMALFPRELMAMMGLSGELLEMAAAYLRMIGFLFPITVMLSYINNLLICYGYPKITMISGIVSNVTNILLCYIALYGNMQLPVSPVEAVAICSGISQLLGIGLSVWFFIRKKCYFTWAFRWNGAKRILKFGIPANMSMISYQLSGALTTGFITGLGVQAINAKVYVSNIVGYTSRFSIALGNAGGVLMGRYRGAGEVEKVKKLYRQNVRLAILCNGAVSLLVLLFHRPLLSVFTDDPQILKIGGIIFAIDVLIEIARGINHISEYAFNANGEVGTPLVTAAMGAWCFNVPLSFLFAVLLGWGVIGLWIAIVADELWKATVYLWRWHRGKWEKIRI